MVETILPEELDRRDKWGKKGDVVVPTLEHDLQHGLVK